MKKISTLALLVFCFAFMATFAAKAAVAPPPFPTDSDQCKHDGWRDFGDLFKNKVIVSVLWPRMEKINQTAPPIH